MRKGSNVKNRISENAQEIRDKKWYVRILNIQDKHKKTFFNTDGCGLEIEFGVVYEPRCRAYIATGLQKMKAFVADRGKFVLDDSIGKFLNVEIVLNPFPRGELKPIFDGILDILSFYENFVFDENCGIHANFRADDALKKHFFAVLTDGRYDSERFSHSKYKKDFNETVRNADGSMKTYEEYIDYQNTVGAKYCGINFLKPNLIEARTLNLSWDDITFFYDAYDDAVRAQHAAEN